jgi:uncharacterized protein involved in cysteine biosynthesis
LTRPLFVEHVREAVALFREHRHLRAYAIKPWLWSTLVFLGVVVLGYFLLVPPLQRMVAGYGQFAQTFITILYFITWIFISGIVFLALTSFLGSFIWDKLSIEVERLIGVQPQTYEPPRVTQISESVKRGVLALCLAALGFGCGFVLPVVAPALVAGYVALLDFTASGFSRRRMSLRAQMRNLKKLNGWQPFLVVGGILTLIPIVNALALPIMVAAGTIMVARSPVHSELQ